MRREVTVFAELMEAKLRENDHKGGWQQDPVTALMARLKEETDELRAVLSRRAGSATPRSYAAEVGREAADIANFAMMVADVCGALNNDLGDSNAGAFLGDRWRR